MRIDGSGTGAWHRDREVSSFGSRAWRAHYGAGSGAQRARHDMASRDRARHEEADTQAYALAQWEASVEQLALDHAAELAAPARRWNRRSMDAQIVRVHHAGLDESALVSLLSHGFRWSQRRGGIWWASRTPEACAVAERVCEAPVICVTD